MYEDVCRFKVPMHNSFFVHVPECTGYLFHETPDMRFIKREVLTFFIFYKFLEVTPFSPLSDNYQLVVMYEGVNVLYDVRVI